MDWHADYILLLNNDTAVHESFLSELVRVAESDSRIGFVGPKIYYDACNGRRDVIAFAGGRINLWIGKACNIGEGEKDIGRYDDIKEVSYVQARVCWQKERSFSESDCSILRSSLSGRRPIGVCVVAARVLSVFVQNAKIWHKVAVSSK